MTYVWTAVLTGVLLWPIPSSALTVVRWGGGPERQTSQDEDFALLKYGWDDLHDARGGRSVDLDFDQSFIGIRRLDSGHNIGPEVRVLHEPDFVIADDDLETAWIAKEYVCEVAAGTSYTCDGIYGRQGTVDFDLGGSFLLDRVRLVSGIQSASEVVRDFRIHVAAELPRFELRYPGITQPLRPVVAEIRDNKLQRREVQLPGDQRVRFLQLAVGRHNNPWTVAELEIYLQGFAEHATWVSDVVDFAAPVVFGPLTWSGQRGERSVVSIQTRSGRLPDPNLYWRFTGRGTDREVVSREQYLELKIGERGGTTLDRANWSSWSSYDFADSAGTPVLSPGPERYFQLRVDFDPNGEEAEVHVVQMGVSPPLATRLVGQVWPVEATTGESASFTYSLRPVLVREDPGFDGLELTTPSLLEGIDSVRVGDLRIPFALPVLEHHRAVLGFQHLGPEQSGALVEVFLRARVLRYGSRFEASVSNSDLPDDVAQRVDPGDATGEFDSQGVAVTTAVRDRLLSVTTDRRLLTPNGDGFGDEVCIVFDILDVTAAVPVGVDILNLSGRVVRRLYEGRHGTGRHRRCWDGRGGEGALAAPGVYFYRVFLDVDDREVAHVGVLGLAY